MAERIQEKQKHFKAILEQIQNDFMGPIHAAIKVFLATYPQIEAVAYTTRGGEYNDNGYDGFGLRGPFFRIREGERFIYLDRYKGTEQSAIPQDDWRNDEYLGRWQNMYRFKDDLLDSVNDYLNCAPYMLLEHGDDALLIWETDAFRVANVVDDEWDA